MQHNGWSSASLPPTNHIFSTTSERRASECKSRLSLRSSCLSHPRWYAGDAEGRRGHKSPIRSGFLINLPTLLLPDFYEFNHTVIKISESKIDSWVISACICPVRGSVARWSRWKCHATRLLSNPVLTLYMCVWSVNINPLKPSGHYMYHPI
jgi:hypothetical protein